MCLQAPAEHSAEEQVEKTRRRPEERRSDIMNDSEDSSCCLCHNTDFATVSAQETSLLQQRAVVAPANTG